MRRYLNTLQCAMALCPPFQCCYLVLMWQFQVFQNTSKSCCTPRKPYNLQLNTTNSDVSSSRRKSRKAHFSASSAERRILMSAPLSKELREKYKIRSLPIRKDDTVTVARGAYKGREGKVSQVYRLKFSVQVNSVSKDKASGAAVPVNFNASKLLITSLNLDADRKALIKRKSGVDCE